MITGKTSSGFEFVLPQNALNNMELLDEIIAYQDGKQTAAFRIAPILLGEEQRKKLYDHLRDEDGIVPVDRVAEEVAEIIGLALKDKDVKNS